MGGQRWDRAVAAQDQKRADMAIRKKKGKDAEAQRKRITDARERARVGRKELMQAAQLRGKTISEAVAGAEVAQKYRPADHSARAAAVAETLHQTEKALDKYPNQPALQRAFKTVRDEDALARRDVEERAEGWRSYDEEKAAWEGSAEGKAWAAEQDRLALPLGPALALALQTMPPVPADEGEGERRRRSVLQETAVLEAEIQAARDDA